MRVARGALRAAALAALFTAAAQGQAPRPTPLPNERPSVKLLTSTGRVVMTTSCTESPVPACTATSLKVGLLAQATDPDGDSLLYTYKAAAGRVEGDGPEATLDLTGVAPGVYVVTVEVDDGNGGVTTDAAKLSVERCVCEPPPLPPRPCPTVTVSCPDMASLGPPVKFSLNVAGGDPGVTPTFKWTVPGLRILSGGETSEMTVEPPAHGGAVVATVEVGGYDRSCPMRASCTTHVIADPLRRKVDEYGDISVGDEKRRLDIFNEELQKDPSAQGYIVCYGGRRSGADEAQRRCDRAANFLVVSRGIDAARFVTVDAGHREKPAVELWLVPSGATPPPPSPAVDPKDVRPPRPPRKPRRR